MIDRIIVEEGEEFVASGGVYNLVYTRRAEGVLRAVFVDNQRTFSILYSSFEQELGSPATQDDTLL